MAKCHGRVLLKSLALSVKKEEKVTFSPLTAETGAGKKAKMNVREFTVSSNGGLSGNVTLDRIS
jgi:hypothetical protein